MPSASDRAAVWRLGVYLLVTFAWSWFFWVPQGLVTRGVVPSEWLTAFVASSLDVAAFGPFVGAVVVTAWNSGLRGIGHLLCRGIALDFPKRWLLGAVGLPILL
uniref:Uncharacterized protein n=1 Tax=Thermomicrobium roseum TaxID=500 RepID=A0A7C5RU84_THERO